MNGFQLTIMGVFILTLIIGVLIFAGVLPGFRAPSGGVGGTVVWWGTIPADDLNALLEGIRQAHSSEFTLEYVQKNPATIENDLLEALALGKGPDLVMLTSDELARQEDKLTSIPYETLPKQTFKDTFVAGAHLRDWELFFGSDGVLGLPLYVDPLVLYYNQDLLSNAKLTLPPRLWSDLGTEIKLLAQADNRGNLNQSAIAIGAFNNIAHAKDILSMLFFQAGNPIVARDTNGAPSVVLKDALGFNKPPAGEAVAFFLRFTDPANTLYSWNSSQPEARESFLRGKLAFYFGFGSELQRLAIQNPQINFYLTLPPQRDTGRQLTVGRFTFLALPRGSKNPATAQAVALILAGADSERQLATVANLPPARNDLLSVLPESPEQAVLYQAAIITRDWLDPAPDKTGQIFRRLVEQTALGRVDAARAVADADDELEALSTKNGSN